MKEIDFLPEWYRTGQQRRVNYRVQCIVLGGVFLVMTVWGLITSRSISNVEAGMAQMTTQYDQAEQSSLELAGIKTDLETYQEKIQAIEEIDSKINVASVLAEISSLVDEMVVLNKIEFIAEKPGKGRVDGSGRPSAVVRVAQAQLGKKNVPLGNVRFKVLIAGVAADASYVATLVSRLEESSYFRQVVLSFSRNGQVGSENRTILRDVDVLGPEGNTGGIASPVKLQVSEFQINCYLGNYREL